ncbi:MAG TPA: ABC transporter ATP-binding protein [Gemmatimonadaceae bacterium]|nr:ABC transporter ATP-binding protein [Gemmatimonadaceae bacterium]
MIALEATGLSMWYRGGDGGRIDVLLGTSLVVNQGEMVAIVGTSGAGKSTLLHCVGALERPTDGRIRVAGQDIGMMSDDDLAALRNRAIGFVFQFHHLLREFSALENVMMPLRIAGTDVRRARSRAEELLARVGLAGRMTHRPAELSGGEQQRCAVARALAMDPTLVLADEPSGNLDHHNAEQLHDLFVELAHDLELAIVVATHNRSLAARADRTLVLADGRLSETGVDRVMV